MAKIQIIHAFGSGSYVIPAVGSMPHNYTQSV